MTGNYVLNIRMGDEVLTYLYPVGKDVQCVADAMAALVLGHRVLIEPPDGVELRGGVKRVCDKAATAVQAVHPGHQRGERS